MFVVRFAMRKTLLNKPLEFNDKNKAIEFFKKEIFEKFNLDISNTLKGSKLLDTIRQRKLIDF